MSTSCLKFRTRINENLKEMEAMDCNMISIKSTSCKQPDPDDLHNLYQERNGIQPDYPVNTEEIELSDISEDTPVVGNHRTKKKRKSHNVPDIIADNPDLRKYWVRRHELFSEFDNGIKLDKESWFSVTPEPIATQIAERCRCDIIIDAFCGAGGNTIQFAFTCERVIAIDIDPQKIALAHHNASVYGVEDRIEFIIGDYVKLAPSLKADVVFLSPPWGGPSYLKEKHYDLEKMLQPIPASELFKLTRNITSDIAFYVPRNSKRKQLALLADPGTKIELEECYFSNKLVALNIYYGSLNGLNSPS